MTCFFKGLGIAVTLAPFILMIMALSHNDWTISNESLVTFDANAQVYEDNIRFRMGPFGGSLHAAAGEQEVFTEKGYQWCAKTGYLPASQQEQLCGLLKGVRATGLLSVVLGGLGILLYMGLAFRSLKDSRVVLGAKVACAVHLLQGLAGILCVSLWAGLTATYHKHLTAALGPQFGAFTLPYGKSYNRAIAASVLALAAAFAMHTMSKRSVAAKERVATIERKRSEFELKELEEMARREAEEELKVPDAVV